MAGEERDGSPSIAESALVTLWALMDKAIGPLAWSSVVIYGLLGIGAWMCLSQQGTRRTAPA